VKDKDDYTVQVEWKMKGMEEVMRTGAVKVKDSSGREVTVKIKEFVVSWRNGGQHEAEVYRTPFRAGGGEQGRWLFVKPVSKMDIQGVHVQIKVVGENGSASPWTALKIEPATLSMIPRTMQARLPNMPPRGYFQ